MRLRGNTIIEYKSETIFPCAFSIPIERESSRKRTGSTDRSRRMVSLDCIFHSFSVGAVIER